MQENNSLNVLMLMLQGTNLGTYTANKQFYILVSGFSFFKELKKEFTSRKSSESHFFGVTVSEATSMLA